MTEKEKLAFAFILGMTASTVLIHILAHYSGIKLM
jgi:hypothetical protein